MRSWRGLLGLCGVVGSRGKAKAGPLISRINSAAGHRSYILAGANPVPEAGQPLGSESLDRWK